MVEPFARGDKDKGVIDVEEEDARGQRGSKMSGRQVREENGREEHRIGESSAGAAALWGASSGSYVTGDTVVMCWLKDTIHKKVFGEIR